eukprot:TRINITY_DN2586_c0_g1_i1.p1 TRINITY_DN2586_c0_g1~~TRINITY_DN2586_c0_g1_i1.p1  ORF type:complete len:506 (+),score=173.11 TRINITY_DN2586_c0_g1_i1:525-2042(+)
MNVSVVDIPPKVTEVYSKNTQTSETSFSDEPAPNAGVTTIKHAESSQQSSNQEDDEQNQKEEEDQQVEVVPEVKALSLAEKERILSSKDFSSFLDHSSRLIERAIYVDTKYDITVDYARSEVGDNKDQSAKEVRLVTKYFDDRWSKHRAITDIAWSPKHNDLIVASYSMNEDNTTDPDGVVLVWSLQNTLQRPEYRFNCQSPVTSAFFSPFSPTLIVGGTYSGQIVLWDIRAKSTPVQQTPLSSVGHTHPVFSMNVVGTTNAHSLVSVSTDGKLCVWSLDNLYQPQETLELHNKASKVVTTAVPVAVTSLSFPEGEVNELYVGSEEGAIYQCFRHGAKSGVNERFEGHRGPITSVDFHPSNGPINFSHLFLSSSTDWTTKLWNPKVSTKPTYSFEDASDYIYDVKWCPSHPSVFASADGTGSLDLWNLNEEVDVPTIKTSVCGNALSKLVWSEDGKKILTGDSTGHLYLYDVGENTTPRADEWQRFEDTVQRLSTGQTEAAPSAV